MRFMRKGRGNDVKWGCFDRGRFPLHKTSSHQPFFKLLHLPPQSQDTFDAMSEPKSIIITGASRGIGLAIARFLLKGGHKLFLVARSGEPLQKLKDEFEEQVEFLAADLSDFEVSGLRLISDEKLWS